MVDRWRRRRGHAAHDRQDEGHRFLSTFAVVWCGGDALGRRRSDELLADLDRLPADRTVLTIAADSGLDRAVEAGCPIDVVVGDMDSVSPDALARAEAAGAEILRHPADKDRTDLELALDLALERGVRSVVVAGGSGGRLDHFAGNLGVLCADRYARMDVSARMRDATAWVVRGERKLHLAPGATLSIVPMHGAAESITTTGLRWALDAETLAAGSGRGLSNVVQAEALDVAVAAPSDERVAVTVALAAGVVLVIVPD